MQHLFTNMEGSDKTVTIYKQTKTNICCVVSENYVYVNSYLYMIILPKELHQICTKRNSEAKVAKAKTGRRMPVAVQPFLPWWW